MLRASRVVGAALLLAAAACNESVSNFVSTLAAVRLVNATDTPLSIASKGVLVPANTRLAFGRSSACVFVDPSTQATAALSITNAVTGASIAFTPTLGPGDNLTVVAYVAAAGEVQLAPLSNHFVPTLNEVGLRFFNGAPNASSLAMRRDTVTLTPFVSFGSASDFVSVPSDSARITFVSSSTVVLEVGVMAFPQGQNSTVVVGPPTQGTGPLRFFIVQGC